MSETSRRIKGKDLMKMGLGGVCPALGNTERKEPSAHSDKAPTVLCRVFFVPTVGTETRQAGKVGGGNSSWTLLCAGVLMYLTIKSVPFVLGNVYSRVVQ